MSAKERAGKQQAGRGHRRERDRALLAGERPARPARRPVRRAGEQLLVGADLPGARRYRIAGARLRGDRSAAGRAGNQPPGVLAGRAGLDARRVRAVAARVGRVAAFQRRDHLPAGRRHVLHVATARGAQVPVGAALVRRPQAGPVRPAVPRVREQHRGHAVGRDAPGAVGRDTAPRRGRRGQRRPGQPAVGRLARHDLRCAGRRAVAEGDAEQVAVGRRDERRGDRPDEPRVA